MAKSPYDGLLGGAFAADGRGPDCWNCGELTLEVLRRAGIAARRPEYDPAVVGTEHGLFDLGASEDWEEVSPPFREFDLLVFRSARYNAGVHCGTFVPPNRVFHAIREAGVCCEDLRWHKQYLIGAYRHKCHS
jgi:hypothetical protein